MQKRDDLDINHWNGCGQKIIYGMRMRPMHRTYTAMINEKKTDIKIYLHIN